MHEFIKTFIFSFANTVPTAEATNGVGLIFSYVPSQSLAGMKFQSLEVILHQQVYAFGQFPIQIPPEVW